MRPYFFLFIGMMFLLFSCQNAEPEESQSVEVAPLPSVPVVIEEVKNLNEALPIISSGVLASQEEKQLSFKIGGVIDQIFVDEGQAVRAGQILAKLDLAEINAQVVQAQSSLSKTMRDLERAQRLYEDTVVTLEQVQDLETATEVAEAALEIAKFNQSYAIIKAEKSGTILRKFSEEGEVVNPGTPVLSWASTQRSAIIRTSLTDIDVVKISLGDTAKIQFDAYPDQIFLALVSEIAASSDPQTGAFEVECTLMPSQFTLKNGFVGKIQLYPTRGDGTYLRIPMEALVEANEHSVTIHVPDDSQKNSKVLIVGPYEIGPDYFTLPVEKYPDLKYVITKGTKYLKDGSPINPTNITL